MADPRIREDFLIALARRLDIRAIVLTANPAIAKRAPRSMWLGESPADTMEIDRLAAVGRAWMRNAKPTAEPTERTKPTDPTGATDQTDAEDRETVTGGNDGEAVAVTELRSPQGTVLGAVLAAKRTGQRWTTAERTLFSFAVAFFRDDLVDLAARPRPKSGLGRAETSDRPQLEERMRTAAHRGELVLLYQPEIDMRTGRVVALEALVRWDHPHHGRLGPDSFIGLAEQSDLIKILGSWVIERSLSEFASWTADAADPEVKIRVNVSPAQLTGSGVIGDLTRALNENGLHGKQVCIEFTETAAAGDIDDLSATLRALNELGVESAIDDLATGYSTLSRLRALPVDTIKIDRSLVTGIDRDERAQVIVGALISMADGLGVAVVAEGVETAAEAAVLLKLGCVRAQGHHFGRPVVGEQAHRLLRAGRVTLDHSDTEHVSGS